MEHPLFDDTFGAPSDAAIRSQKLREARRLIRDPLTSATVALELAKVLQDSPHSDDRLIGNAFIGRNSK